jgi:CheY-like chemotaxis protein
LRGHCLSAQNPRFMIVNLCHACRRINPPTAQRCGACGRELGDGDTWPSPLSRLAAAPLDTALWLNDLGQVHDAPHAVDLEAEPAPLDISLRDLDVPAPFVAPAQPRPQARLPWPASDTAPPPQEPAIAAACAAVAPGPARASLEVDPVARAAWKVARRGGVRRSRLARSAGAVADVLVLDRDDSARHPLCALLQAFGFNVHAAAGAIEAAALAAERTVVAAFLDVALDGSDGGAGLDLTRRLSTLAPPNGASHPLLVLVSARLGPIDRVRAELAGFDEMLAKPVNRGSVARVLDSRGIALPSDARRARK